MPVWIGLLRHRVAVNHVVGMFEFERGSAELAVIFFSSCKN